MVIDMVGVSIDTGVIVGGAGAGIAAAAAGFVVGAVHSACNTWQSLSPRAPGRSASDNSPSLLAGRPRGPLPALPFAIPFTALPANASNEARASSPVGTLLPLWPLRKSLLNQFSHTQNRDLKRNLLV